MLTESEIISNRERFISLVRSITRPNIDMEGLLSKLDSSDWYEAPASAKYHNAFRGGLVAHSLNVYDILVKLNTVLQREDREPYSEDTLKIVALFHDFDKMNKYETTVFNKKKYSELGLKHDEMGKFDWVAEMGYKRKDEKDTFSIGLHGENSTYMTETYIPLSVEEHCAIMNHHSVYDSPNRNITGIYSKYHLACMLHLADMAATYICES